MSLKRKWRKLFGCRRSIEPVSIDPLDPAFVTVAGIDSDPVFVDDKYSCSGLKVGFSERQRPAVYFLEALRRAVADREREIPEGVTDLESLYLLWDLPLPAQNDSETKWTSVRVSPQQVIELGRVHGTLNAVFNANRSETFGLAMVLLGQFLEDGTVHNPAESSTLSDLRKKARSIYL